MLPVIIFSIWVSLGIVGAGFGNAFLRATFPTTERDAREAARDKRFCLVFGVVFGPAALLLMLLYSGFGYDGWTLSSKPTGSTGGIAK